MSYSSGILSTLFSFCCVVGVFGSIVSNGGYKDTKPFKDFSYSLLLQSDLDEFSVEKGAAISSPFGVGYMLANINEQIWNVSNNGMDNVLNYKDGKIADEYQSLIDLMNKGKMSTGSTLFTRDQNISSKFPEGSLKMKTETKLVDFIEEWKQTWQTMNARISNQTNGRLDDQLIPKGGWWGGAFYYFTMGAFINTNHYKSSWAASWTSVGAKKFHDGLTVPFYETEGTVPVLESDNYTAVAIGLKEGKKSVVFVLPKVPFVEFLKSDMIKLVLKANPQSWNSPKAMKIQFPALNITLLDQHYKKLEALGLNYTFCVDEPESLDVATKKGPYFMGPIVQSHHIQFSPEFFEVATATGASLNSEEKMREEGQFDFHGTSPSGPAPTAPGEQVADGSEFVLPVDMDLKLVKSLADGSIEVEKVDVIVADKDNDTITAASTSSVEEVAAPSTNETTTSTSTTNATDASPTFIPTVVSETELTTPTPTSSPTTQFITEPLPENTIRFDRPFFWYLYDEEMGPLYYGTVHSLATYEKEYGIETDEDLWLYDAYKTLLWNCP